ncbi:MAG: HD domain-containing protein [Nevskiaceae bacterium]|jgi:putative hydrolase of HD superfamily|nr:HD domain-containing protein [Nevskiaceae bacterium]
MPSPTRYAHSNISQIADFLLQFDALKSVNRRSYINRGERVENSAEHSWHLAIACWAFAEQLQDDFDLLKLIQLALVHDLGEIGAGDTFLYSPNRADAHIKERESITTLTQHPGNPIGNLAELWEEQEAGKSKEARLLKVIDRLLPFLHNIASEGRSWRENGIHKNQILKMHQFMETESPEIYSWFMEKLEYAVAQGWLNAS